jgi:hypothetical protein
MPIMKPTLTLLRFLPIAHAPIFFAIFIIALAGNLPLLSPYHLYADDYPYYAKGIAVWLHDAGIWRIAGIMLIKWLVQHHVYGIAAIILHALTGYLLYLIMVRAFANVFYAFLLAVLFVAFPWGYQSLVWSGCACFAFGTLFSLIVLYGLMSIDLERRHPLPVAIALAVLSFIGLLFNEAAFFIMCIAGGTIATRREPLRFRRDVLLGLAPFAGAVVWASLYKLLEPESPYKQVSKVNWRSVLSPIFYQYSNLEVFDVWLISPLRQYAFSVIPTYAPIVTALLVLAVIPLIWAILPRIAALQATRTAASRGVVSGRFALYSLVLLLSAAAVYALGGGYSLEARKRYLIVVNVILMIGALSHWLWDRFMRRSEAMRVHTHSDKLLTVMAIVLITLGCTTSLMMMSVWQRELARLDSLLATVVSEHLKGPIAVEWNPYLFNIWPHAERS